MARDRRVVGVIPTVRLGWPYLGTPRGRNQALGEENLQERLIRHVASIG